MRLSNLLRNINFKNREESIPAPSGAQSTRHLDMTLRPLQPPDGGVKAYLVVICSFLVNGIVFGIINSYGVIFVHLKNHLKDDEVASTKASLVGSITLGATFFLSGLAGILSDKFGIRLTVFLGGFLAFIGILASSFCIDKIEILFFTYGILFGSGSALAFSPSLSILGHYFRRHLGLVNGIVSTGSSIFTMAIPHILECLISYTGLKNTLLCMAGLPPIIMFASLSFTPYLPVTTNPKWINVENWKNKKYVLWALIVPIARFGYYVPFFHCVQYAHDVVPGENGATLVTCMAVSSGLGRVIFGKMADMSCINAIALQQISFIFIGTCTMLLTVAPYFQDYTFHALVVLALIFGLFEGCMISIQWIVAFKLVGTAGASQAIGFSLCLNSIPLTIGTPLAGILYDHFGNYQVAFIVAGIPSIVGAILMCFIYRVKGTEQDQCTYC